MKLKCSECGKKILPNKDKCLNCGAPIEPVSEKEYLRYRVEKSKKVKKILFKTAIVILSIIIPFFLIGYLSYEFLPNGEEAYYCDKGYTFYAVGKICVKGDKQYKAKIKKLNNHTREDNNISFQFVSDENNETIQFMGSNCFGRWSDEVQSTFCYGYEDMTKYEEFNKVNDYKNLSKEDRFFIKINGIWGTSNVDGKMQFIFYPDNKKCKVTDIDNKKESKSCEYSLNDDEIKLDFSFSTNGKKEIVLSYNDELTELYYGRTTYTKTESMDIKTTGWYLCDELGYTLIFSDGYNVSLHESCRGSYCPYYEGVYGIDGNILRISVASNKSNDIYKTEYFTIINENEIVNNYNRYSYIWEPFPTGGED